MPITDPIESEWLTRKQRIDPRLRAAGWKLTPYNPTTPLGTLHGHAITEYPTENGPADYALCVHGRILGVVEAKKLTLGTQNVLTQAERYSRGLIENPINIRGYHAPFLYSTNGVVIWFDDIRNPTHRSRQIARAAHIGVFHTPAALAELFTHNTTEATRRLRDLPNQHDLLRPYQNEATDAVEAALAENKRRSVPVLNASERVSPQSR